MKFLRAAVILIYCFLAMLPLVWLLLTSIKPVNDVISPTAKVLPVLSKQSPDGGIRFQPTVVAYRGLGRPLQGKEHGFYHYLRNSIIIGLLSTVASVLLGTSCAYGFSRFKIAGARDWLFFILSTRFLPPLVVVVPVLKMYREFELEDTHIGLIILYTSFNLSLSVWLMKGFIDEIPRAFEEAALVDGYSRMAAFWKIIVPQARTGMAATAVFCLISAWNEYGFAMILNRTTAVTVPTYFASLQGNLFESFPWPRIAAGALLFVIPIVVFIFLVRNYLLRSLTFGTIKQ